MNWTTPDTPGGTDDETGYPLPGIPGIAKSVPCRFHLGGVKVFKNKDNTTVNQTGQIRLDAGVDLPEVGDQIEVVGQFKGKVQDVYRGQLSHRIDV
ncbi:hypothetical protein SAMN05421821_105133 [Mucilaginibacter lappiensis]|uniref:Uncharacterized protein n=1 Tax=Mucilaginibacter lappiensis TaxID=354630 RepID=A0ABR6PIW3_9SPHI|nr:hypothetical protein [Mucilaginibacter lappiensis]MBB6109715.1 hypothetical protein [Mucilaginibacter lappiensis]SIR12869.1 hypothetical protein SAMN05421821_105133 [Mucilaginibacter lappiensis]